MERDFYPSEILITRGALSYELTDEIVGQFPEAEVRYIDSILKGHLSGVSMKEGIEWGKTRLAVDAFGKSVKRFKNKDEGAVCPNFWKLLPATHCPFDCQYCYLQQTYRVLWPWSRVNVDVAGMLRQVEREIAKHVEGGGKGGLLFNSGEMCDSLATGGLVPGLVETLVEHFAGLGDNKLLLLTKSAKVQPLLGLEHGGNTIAAWSVNCQRAADEVELGTASLDERISAARACQQAGYALRLRFDPLVYMEGWQEQYSDMVERVLGELAPERITLGLLRLQNALGPTIESRFPDSVLLEQPLEKLGKRWRYGHGIRREMYEFVLAEIRKHIADLPVSICKETHQMWRELGGKFEVGVCNCVA